jgi:hypothetical protein
MKIPLPAEYNTDQIKEKIAFLYPDSEVKIVPDTYTIKGGDRDAVKEDGYIHLKVDFPTKEEKVQAEMALKQAVFELVPEKNDEQQRDEEKLKSLLLRPEIVYLVDRIAELEKRLAKLEKKDDKQLNGASK